MTEETTTPAGRRLTGMVELCEDMRAQRDAMEVRLSLERPAAWTQGRDYAIERVLSLLRSRSDIVDGSERRETMECIGLVEDMVSYWTACRGSSV